MTTEHKAAIEEEVFGPYVVYERIGIGGMATVHRAKERGIEGFERIVALKRLLPHLAEDAGFVRSFVREAKLASLLQHANIVQLYELGRVGHVYFISMEHIEGWDVRRILRRARKITGPPPLPVFLSLMSQLLEALDYAHRRCDHDGQPLGLVHRDVSPSNLLITHEGHLKVIDFGIAKAQSIQLRTQTGRVKGKLAYLAPEAIKGQELDARSDIFSAGIIAHELLTARPLFATKNEYQTLMRVQRADVERPSTINSSCPAALDDIVLKALARNRDRRWQSAAELRDALHALRVQYRITASNREVAAWMEWAFSLDEPPTGAHARHPSHSGAFSAVQSVGGFGSSSDVYASPYGPAVTPGAAGALAPQPASRAEDDVIAYAWGNEDDRPEPVLLEEVPDYGEVEPHVTDPAPLPPPPGRTSSVLGDTGDPYIPSLASGATTIPGPRADVTVHHGSGHEPDPDLDLDLEYDEPEIEVVARRQQVPRLPRVARPISVGDAAGGPARSAPGARARDADADADAAGVRFDAIVREHRSRRVRAVVLGVLAVGAGAAAFFAVRGRDRVEPAPPAATATLKFAILPEDVTIAVEGEGAHVGSPYRVEVAPGTYQVEISRDGYRSWVSQITLEEGELRTVQTELQRAGRDDTRAIIKVETVPSGLTVTIDGEPVEGVSPVSVEVDPGVHTVAVSKDGAELWRAQREAAANTQYVLQPDLQDQLVAMAARLAREERRRRDRADVDDSDGERRIIVEPDRADPARAAADPDAGDAGTNTVEGVATRTAPLRALNTAVPPPVPSPPRSPRPSGPVTALPGEVVKRSGTIPVIEVRGDMDDIRIGAKLCIGTSGRVTDVAVLTAIPGNIKRSLVRALERWRYEPVERAGVPVPACFPINFKLDIRR